MVYVYCMYSRPLLINYSLWTSKINNTLLASTHTSTIPTTYDLLSRLKRTGEHIINREIEVPT